MGISADELASYFPMVRYGERVDELMRAGTDVEGEVYIRLRHEKPTGGKAVFGKQIWPERNDQWRDEVVDRIRDFNPVTPVYVEVIRKGQTDIMDTCEVPPLLEALDQALGRRVQNMQIAGESAVTIELIKSNTAMVMASERRTNEFFDRWKTAENDALLARNEAANIRMEMLLGDMSSGDDSDDDSAKWAELRKLASDVMSGATAPLAALSRIVELKIDQALEEKKKSPPAQETVTPSSPVTEEAEPTEEAQEVVTPEILADATLEHLVSILEHQPELLTLDRLKALAPHAEKLKAALMVLEATADIPPEKS